MNDTPRGVWVKTVQVALRAGLSTEEAIDAADEVLLNAMTRFDRFGQNSKAYQQELDECFPRHVRV